MRLFISFSLFFSYNFFFGKKEIALTKAKGEGEVQ